MSEAEDQVSQLKALWDQSLDAAVARMTALGWTSSRMVIGRSPDGVMELFVGVSADQLVIGELIPGVAVYRQRLRVKAEQGEVFKLMATIEGEWLVDPLPTPET